MVAGLLILARRAVCRARGHDPIRVIDKATPRSVAVIDGGEGLLRALTGSGWEMQVQDSHVYCRRCRATQHTTLDGITKWVS